MHPNEMTTEQIVTELLQEIQGSLSEAEYAILYASEQRQDDFEVDYVEGM